MIGDFSMQGGHSGGDLYPVEEEPVIIENICGQCTRSFQSENRPQQICDKCVAANREARLRS